MSQKHRLLAWLRSHRTITHLEAEKYLGICRVAARVCELRREGHNIDSDRETSGKASWVRYRLIEYVKNDYFP